jgi:uncharacterized protein (TIGR02217 family)
MAFHEIRFPDDISQGSSGGPERRTEVVTLRSGYEQRNSIWQHSRRRYDAGLGIRDIDDVYTVLSFFEGRMGRLHAFRWKDWADYKSCSPGVVTTNLDEQIGVGTGSLTTFQLTKKYTSGSQTYTRTITKPVQGTVKISKASVAQTEGTHYTVNYTTGVVTFLSAPANGQAIRAGFEFDVPVRFDSDYLAITVDAFEAGSLPSIEIIEVRV